MLGRDYFENVLPDQLRAMERPVRLTLHLATGHEQVVHALVAIHDAYIVLKVYSDGKAAQHSKRWQADNPEDDQEIFDQICVPYHAIMFAYLTARSTKGDDSRRLIGFEKA